MVKIVNYDAIIQRAQEIAMQRMKSGEPIGPDDTVCVLSSASGRLFTGLNHLETQSGISHNVHAEVEAIRNMQVMGESVIQALLLISISNGMPLLPCFDCMRQILALHTDNINCQIMTARFRSQNSVNRSRRIRRCVLRWRKRVCSA